MKNKPYLLALNRINQIGPRTIMKLLEHWPSLEELFKLPERARHATGMSAKLSTAISAFNMAEVDTDLNWEQACSTHHILTWEDNAYPPLLKEIHDPPAVIYAQGDLTCLQQPTIAVVGTRKPSITGKETAFRFAYELAKEQITIVSGLALGVDTQAHQGSLAAFGKTIAVMGTGIDRIYPHQNLQLSIKIKDNGLLLTEFPLKSVPTAGHFPRRNRIISGLSLSTLVVEAAIRSGSLITARFALEQNRDVLAIPGSIHNPQARGCHYLLQQGAKLVTSSHEILDESGIERTDNSARESSVSLATNIKNLVKCVGFEITTVDQIIQRSNLDIRQVACDLAELELQGIVQAVPGGYTRCK